MKSNKKTKQGKIEPILLYDGMNTIVPDKDPITNQEPSSSEADLYKQAANPLGDPHKT